MHNIGKKPKVFFELSGIHPEMPFEEIFGILESQSIPFKIVKRIPRILILEIEEDNINKLFYRPAFCKSINRLILRSNFNLREIEKEIKQINFGDYLDKGSTFSVRIKSLIPSSEKFNISVNSEILETKLGQMILDSSKVSIKVDLENPELLFRGIFTKNELILGIQLTRFNSKKYQARAGPNKPFFHPCGLDPKFARLMVNLARPREREIIYDPFCGIGSILIEAGLIGYRTIGSDVSWKMINGCLENLEYYNISNSEILKVDSRFSPIRMADTIVTDPPYGKASVIEANSVKSLYKKFLRYSRDLIKENKFMVFASPKKLETKIRNILKNNDFLIDKKFDYYIHRSLIRNIWIVKI
ncbi:MAG: N-6 DNA methylase [Candidatus Lokiarchaeota archaeon]|nr:N-6 DNA methylase [Candidatus Lokiarchaeota archaeon]